MEVAVVSFCLGIGLSSSSGRSFPSRSSRPSDPLIYHCDGPPRRQHQQQHLLWACEEQFTPWSWRRTDARPVFQVSSWPIYLFSAKEKTMRLFVLWWSRERSSFLLLKDFVLLILEDESSLEVCGPRGMVSSATWEIRYTVDSPVVE